MSDDRIHIFMRPSSIWAAHIHGFWGLKVDSHIAIFTLSLLILLIKNYCL